MIVAIHQPHYLPWLGYFDKIAKSDLFVFLDRVQFRKRNFQNRNKIKTANGAIWLTVPVFTKGRFDQEICEVEINNSINWRRKHWNSIEHAYKNSQFFGKYADDLRSIYETDWQKLDDLNRDSVSIFAELLGIETPMICESTLDVRSASTERLIEICKNVGATAYFSGVGAKNYMDESLFKNAEIDLIYQNFHHPIYPQLHGDFVSHLSIIDLLFNCGDRSLEILTVMC